MRADRCGVVNARWLPWAVRTSGTLRSAKVSADSCDRKEPKDRSKCLRSLQFIFSRCVTRRACSQVAELVVTGDIR